MVAKKIAVKLSEDEGNTLGWGSDGGLFGRMAVLYGGVADDLGLGLSPAGWQKTFHNPNQPGQYWLYPPPTLNLKKEGYAVVCTPRADPTKEDYIPAIVHVHKLEPTYVHIQVTDFAGNPIDCAFTWIIMVPHDPVSDDHANAETADDAQR